MISSGCVRKALRILLCLATLAASGIPHAQEPAGSPPPAGREPRFDVEVAEAPARAFFQGLVDGTPQNMLVHPDVTGRITVTLKQVTLEEALGAVRDLYGYDYRRVPSGYMVLPANIQTRAFQLNYLDLQRHGMSKTRVSSGQISQGGNAAYGDAAATTDNADVVAGEFADVSGTAVLSRNGSDFWAGVAADLRAIVGEQPDHSVVINSQSGVIVIRAMPQQLRDVADYLQVTEQTMTRQVVLEAKIVEVELNDAYQAGINWAAVLSDGDRQYFFGQASPPRGFEDPLTPSGDPIIVAPGNPVNGFVNSALGGAFTLAADFADFNAFIELLAAQGNTRVLSSPRVSTLHNQKAIIKAGTDEFFVTGIQSTTIAGTTLSTTLDVDLTPFFSGVALDVTPQIAPDGNVILHMHPTISEVSDQTKTVSVSGEVNTLPLALSQIRESDSIVRARSGQVIVIGGLMRETRRKDNHKTPLLGDIPGVGRLFRSERDQSTTVELVILLRPLVVADQDWPALVQGPNERLKELAQKGKLE